MKNFLLKYTVKFWGTLLVLLLVFCGPIYYFGETTAGLQSAIRIARHFIPGEIAIGQAQGKLFSNFSLADVKYHNKNVDVSIQSVNLNWQMTSLLQHKFQIKDIEVNYIKITSQRSSSPALSEPNLNWLANIRVEKAEINDLVFIQDQNLQIRLQGSLTQNWNIKWDIQIPNLNRLLPQGQGSFVSTGKLSGSRFTPRIQADFTANQLIVSKQKMNQLAGKLDLSLQANTPFTLTLTGSGLNVHDKQLAKIDLAVNGIARLTQNNIVTQFEIAIAHKPYINAQLSVPKTININNYSTAAISAQLKINLADIHSLKDYIPVLENPHGSILGALEFKGSLSKPEIDGDVKLGNGSLNIAALGIALEKINLHIKGDESRHLTYTGSFQLGTGIASLQGATDVSKPSLPTEISLRGDKLQIVNLADYKISASPNLKLHINNFKLFIDGDLTIPEAKIAPKDFRQTVTLSDDIVILDSKIKAPASPAEALAAMPTMKIAVKLDNVLLHYQDLKTTLAGDLSIQTSPQTQALATGLLYTKKGTYHAYGKVLNIQVGRLSYTGGLINNPGLNIKATRDINVVNTGSTNSFSSEQAYMGSGILTVGVQILGTLDKPKISLFSSGSGISQDNILSYLILGIPRSQASITDSLAILNATSSLNLGASNAPAKLMALKQKLQKGLGLAEFDIEKVQTFDPTANQNTGAVVGTTSLVLGKKLTKKLYAHYSVSLFNATPVSIFNLRYQLNKHWSVQSETSSLDNGADLLYTIERD